MGCNIGSASKNISYNFNLFIENLQLNISSISDVSLEQIKQ